jgi:hypothetical protein
MALNFRSQSILEAAVRLWHCQSNSSPPPSNGEDGPASVLAVSGCTVGADDHFLDDLLAFSTGIVGVVLFAFASLIRANERVGTGTIRVLLAAPFQDNVLAGSPGWHDALTQLTAKHDNEPMNRPSGWLTSRQGNKPQFGQP